MLKDFEGSAKYAPEIMDTLKIDYQYRDACVDFQVEYLSCVRQQPLLTENALVYSLPLINRVSQCQHPRQQWKACQNFREKEIFEEMRKVYLKNIKSQQGSVPNKFTQESAAP